MGSPLERENLDELQSKKDEKNKCIQKILQVKDENRRIFLLEARNMVCTSRDLSKRFLEQQEMLSFDFENRRKQLDSWTQDLKKREGALNQEKKKKKDLTLSHQRLLAKQRQTNDELMKIREQLKERDLRNNQMEEKLKESEENYRRLVERLKEKEVDDHVNKAQVAIISVDSSENPEVSGKMARVIEETEVLTESESKSKSKYDEWEFLERVMKEEIALKLGQNREAPTANMIYEKVNEILSRVETVEENVKKSEMYAEWRMRRAHDEMQNLKDSLKEIVQHIATKMGDDIVKKINEG